MNDEFKDLANVVATETVTLDVLTFDGVDVDRISIPLHEMYAYPEASQRLLDDSTFDVEAWLAIQIGARFARLEEQAFINGHGHDMPIGILHHPKVPNVNWKWGEIGYISTGTTGDFDADNPADALINLIYALDAEYRQGAAFIMNSKTAGEIRKMKDNQGRFIWMEGMQAGQPPLVLGYPVQIVEEMPDLSNNSFSIAFGNFRKGYTIAERPDMRILRDTYSAKPNVIFHATKKVGGDVTDYAAIKLLRFDKN